MILANKIYSKAKSIVFGTLFSTVALIPASNLQAQEQSGNVASSGWFKTCNEEGENTLCNVQYRVVTSQGNQLLMSINLIEISGSVSRKVFRIIVPTARSLPEGIQVQIDGQRSVVVPYTYCRPQICAAEAQLSDGLVKAFKAGGALNVTTLNFQDKQNVIPVTLKGFTASFDGPAIKQEQQISREEQIKKQLEDKLKSQ